MHDVIRAVPVQVLALLCSVHDVIRAVPVQVLALLCMMCAAPAYEDTQHWFLLVVTGQTSQTVFW